MAVAGGGLSAPAAPVPAAELVNALPFALLVLDPQGVVRDANSAAELLLNLSSATMVGRMLGDMLVLPLEFVRRAEVEAGFSLALYDQPLMTTRGQRFRADFVVSPLVERSGWSLLSLQHGAAAHRMGHRLEQSGGVRSATGAAAMLAHEIKIRCRESGVRLSSSR